MEHRPSLPLGDAPRVAPECAGMVLAAVAAILPPLAVFAPLGIAPLLALVALALLILAPRFFIAALGDIAGLVFLLAMLALWAIASAAWSILPEHSLLEGARFLAVSAFGLIAFGGASTLSPSARARVGTASCIGVSIAVGLLLVERFSVGALSRWALAIGPDATFSLTRFDRGVTVMVLALWPALMAGTIGRGKRLTLAIAVPATAFVLYSTTSMLAVLFGMAIFLIGLALPRLTAAALALGVLAIALVLPLAAPGERAVIALHHEVPWLKPSVTHRLLVWRFTADRIAERPFLGWGMDASRELPGGHRDFSVTLPELGLPSMAPALPLHPHDAALQWQVELGQPGTALGLAIIFWLLWRIGWRSELSRQRRAGALAFAAAALVIGLLSFGVWQAWWQSCLWLTAALYAGTGSDAG